MNRQKTSASVGAIFSIGLLCLGVGCGSGGPVVEETPKGAPPAAPTDVVAVRGNERATVSWTAPASSDAEPITGYLVTSNTGVALEATETSLEFAGLTNGTKYTFTVQAKNARGLGAASAPSNEVVPATVPGAPTIVSATRGDRSVALSWTAPEETGGEAITGYVVTPSAGEPVKTSETTLTFGELTNGTKYTFTVRAENAVGPGAEATSDEVVPATVPGAPTIVSATRGDRSVVLSWTAPEETGGEAITGYVVTPSAGESHDASGTPYEFTGLTVGQEYAFTVRALNAIGSGLPSAASQPLVAASVPGAPTNLAVELDLDVATLTWNAPENDGGAPIHGYIVSASDERRFETEAHETTLTVTRLLEGVPYVFDIRAQSDIGEGAAVNTEEVVYIDHEWARWPLPSISASNHTATVDIVTDETTQLQWQRNMPDTEVDWTAALDYCASLTLEGEAGWRLPTRIELESLVARNQAAPVINLSRFPAPAPAQRRAWSATPEANPLPGVENAWTVDFQAGSHILQSKSNTAGVRCVR